MKRPVETRNEAGTRWGAKGATRPCRGRSLRSCCTAVLASVLWAGLLVLAPGCGGDPPTGVTREDLLGVWTGMLGSATLLGRSITGEIDWVFDRSTFEIRFVNALPGELERMGGNWKFAKSQVVLTLQTSFPIGSDVGATDSLFVSILGDEMSVQTSAGSMILLQKTQSALLMGPARSQGGLVCRFEMSAGPGPSGSSSHRNPSAKRSWGVCRTDRCWRHGSSSVCPGIAGPFVFWDTRSSPSLG